MDTWSLRCSNYGAVLTFEYLVSAFFLRNNALIVGITFFIIILKQHFCLSILSIKHHDTLSQVPQLPVASGLGNLTSLSQDANEGETVWRKGGEVGQAA